MYDSLMESEERRERLRRRNQRDRDHRTAESAQKKGGMVSEMESKG